MRVGKPGVERQERHLDGKGDGKGEEQPALDPEREKRRLEREVIEAQGSGGIGGDEGQEDDGDEHEHAPRHRIEKELERRIHPPPAPPDPDQEVHRDQHRLPEHVEEEEIERDEDPDHRRLEQHEEGEVGVNPAMDRPRGAEDRDRREEGGEEHEEEAQPIHAQVIGGADLIDPARALDELETGVGAVEGDPDAERDQEGEERAGERHHAGSASRPPLRHEEDEKSGERRDEDRVAQEAHGSLLPPRRISAPPGSRAPPLRARSPGHSGGRSRFARGAGDRRCHAPPPPRRSPSGR